MVNFVIITIIFAAISAIMLFANSILSRFVTNGNRTAVYTAERITAWTSFISVIAATTVFVGGYIICILASL